MLKFDENIPRRSTNSASVCHQVMLLLQKTNKDWWSVRKSTGQEGYVPANYIREVDPKVIRKTVKRPTRVQVKQPVKKTGYRKETVVKRRKKVKGTTLRRTPSGTCHQVAALSSVLCCLFSVSTVVSDRVVRLLVLCGFGRTYTGRVYDGLVFVMVNVMIYKCNWLFQSSFRMCNIIRLL